MPARAPRAQPRRRQQRDRTHGIEPAPLTPGSIACLPEFFVRDALADDRLRAVLDDHVASRTPFYVLWPSGRHPLPKLRAFIDYMAEHLSL